MSIEIYPVVHVANSDQVAEQSEIALELGADGIYLIDHHHSTTDIIIGAFNKVRQNSPSAFVGINFLQFGSPTDSLRFLGSALTEESINQLPNGLWVDDARTQKEEAAILRGLNDRLRGIRYLGGVSFKYTSRYTEDPALAALEARTLSPFVDVVTTSGPGTGKAPTPEKISAMKKAIGSQALAVASGITIENLNLFTDSIDELLVSTSIEIEPYSGIFDPYKLRDLIAEAHR
jgi:predicted TIM-barrel enzyme